MMMTDEALDQRDDELATRVLAHGPTACSRARFHQVVVKGGQQLEKLIPLFLLMINP
jgi:hypothetical protein